MSLFLALCVTIALLVSYSIACIRFAHVGSDQRWLLYAAGRVLAGATLYGPRITESNPPLIVWFSTLPDLLGRWLHASPVRMLKLFVFAMVFASAGWCARILWKAKLATSPLLICLCVCAVTAVEVSRDLNKFGQFGQREQLLVVLALPYLFYIACGSKLSLGTAERIALGIAAGVGICLKPQQVLLIAVMELFLLIWSFNLRRRLCRAEFLAFVLTVCAYVLLVALATPYFSYMVPLLRETYWAFSDTGKLTLLRSAFLRRDLLLALVVWAVLRRHLKYPEAPLALLAASIGAGVAFVLQGTAWSYHLFPSTVLLVCSLGWIVVDLLSRQTATTLRETLALAACTLLLVAVASPAFLAREYRQVALNKKYRTPLSFLLAQYPPRTSVYIFSTSLGIFYDISQDHLLWASRYGHLWLLPAIVENERARSGGPPARRSIPPSRLRELAAKQRSDTADDLRLDKPPLVIVEHCGPETPCQALGTMDFDILPWFLESSDFAAQWSNYRLQSTDRAYDVYKRTP